MGESTKQQILNALEDCYNPVYRIAQRSGFSETTVRKYLKILLLEGAIKRINVGVYSPSWVYVTKAHYEELTQEMERIRR